MRNNKALLKYLRNVLNCNPIQINIQYACLQVKTIVELALFLLKIGGSHSCVEKYLRKQKKIGLLFLNFSISQFRGKNLRDEFLFCLLKQTKA